MGFAVRGHPYVFSLKEMHRSSSKHTSNSQGAHYPDPERASKDLKEV